MTPELTPEAELAQLQAALAQARGELQAFMHTVSHDLRAPLRHITSYARILQEDLGPDMSSDTGCSSDFSDDIKPPSERSSESDPA